MKKAFTVFSLFMLVAIVFPFNSVAYDFEIDGIFYNINGNEATVTFAEPRDDLNPETNKYTGDVVIPENVTYNGINYPVTAIGYGAFWDCSALTSIEIPNSVININKRAFRGCEALTTVNLPNSVIFLGEDAFCGCDNLSSVNLSTSLATIDVDAFRDCVSLTSVTIPSSVTTINQGAFYRCSGLKDVYSLIDDPWAISMAIEGKEVFYLEEEDYTGRTLHVPVGAVELYQAHTGWFPFFGSIAEIEPTSYQRGDVDGDGQISIADVTTLIDYLLSGSW